MALATPFLVEGFLHVFLGMPTPQVWPPNVDADREIRDLADPAARKSYRFRTSSLGMRGTEPEPGAEVALFVGNSTTECEGISNPDTWPERAAGKAGLTAANAARSGMLLRHNILQARKSLSDLEAAGCRVRTLVLMPGAIDLQRFLAVPENLPVLARMDTLQRFEVLQQAFPGLSFHYPTDPWYKRNLSMLYLRRVKGQLFPERRGEGNEVDHHKRRELRLAGGKVPLPPAKAEAFAAFLASFRDELDALVGEAAERHVPVLLVSQPVCRHPGDWRLWNSGALDAGPDPKALLAGKAPYLREEDFIALAARMGRAVSEAADSSRGIRFVDLAESLPVEPGLFYDTFHFTEAGCVRAGEIVGKALAGPPADFRRAGAE